MKRKILFVAIILFSSNHLFAQTDETSAIKQILIDQTVAWNNGDLNKYMQTYWRSDSLMFIGSKGITWGWESTLKNYKAGYPNTEAMGELSFDIIQLKKLSDQYYFVVGKWKLKRTKDELSGHFNLLIQKIKNKWVIVADHSS